MAKSLGSLSATACTHHDCGWRLRRTTYSDNVRSMKAVPKTAWSALGFTDSMSLLAAKQRCYELNAQNAIQRQDQASKAGIAARVERDRLCHSAFIPDDRNTAFLEWLEVNTSGTAAYVEKQKIIWGTAKVAIIAMKLSTEHFAAHKKQIFRYFSTHPRQYSSDYVRKLTGLMNLYGTFCARLTGKYYEPIPAPRGSEKEMINDAYRKSSRYRGKSDPLETDVLATLATTMPREHYNWLFVTVWFGLRPIEASMVMTDRIRRYWRIEEHGDMTFLVVYQSKLTALPEPDRWKYIPVKYAEQHLALAMIIEGGAKAPLVKTIQAKTNNYNLNLYGGRNGFTDLMLDLGEDLVAASEWMGHQTIERTWTKYKNKRKVNPGLKLVVSK